MKRDEMPVGFSMALAQNPEATQKFALLSEEKKKEIINGTHSVNSKQEMHEYVSSKRTHSQHLQVERYSNHHSLRFRRRIFLYSKRYAL